MPAVVYVVFGDSFSDGEHYQWPVRAFLSEEGAVGFAAECATAYVEWYDRQPCDDVPDEPAPGERIRRLDPDVSVSDHGDTDYFYRSLPLGEAAEEKPDAP